MPKLPATFTSQSPRPGFHVFFRHTARSRALGSRVVRNGAGTIVEFKHHNQTVCAPGCTRSDGGKYVMIDESALVDFPDDLADWLEFYAPKKATHDRVPVHEDFDFDDLCGFYEIEILGDGPWYSPRYCPVKGDQHTKITDCAFYFDGEYLGWKDHAANCAGADMSIGQLIKFLNEQKGEPYRGPIWSDRDEEEELDVSQSGDDQDHTEPAAASQLAFLKVFPNAVLVTATAVAASKEQCYAGAGTGCRCGGEHKYNQSNLSAETRANLDAVLAEANEQSDAETTEVETDEADAVTEEPTEHILTADEVITSPCDLQASKITYVEAIGPTDLPPGTMYGRMGEWARATELPPEIAYVAVLTAYSALPKYDEILGVRFNLYSALLMPVGGGKNLALSRSAKILELRNGIDYMDATIGGAGGLFHALGNKTEGRGKDKVEIPGPRKMLINPNEFAATMTNMKLENSTLAAHLSNLWDTNHITLPVREGSRDINCRVSVLGALPVNKNAPESFTRYFGEETAAGLHSRFLFGYSDTKLDHRWAERWKWSPPIPDDVADYVLPQVPPLGWTKEADDYYTVLALPYDEDGRGLFNLKRIALLTATANSDKYVTLACLKAAELFMLWQLRLKRFFRPGSSERISHGELSTIIMDTLTRIDADGKYERSPVINGNLNINITRVIHKYDWKRYGIEAVQRTIASLIKAGLLQPGFKLNTKGKVVSSKFHVVVSRFLDATP